VARPLDTSASATFTPPIQQRQVYQIGKKSFAGILNHNFYRLS
jgi:hypothetical protein